MKAKKNKVFPVVDVFAGPGGLGEGFAAYIDELGQSRCALIRNSLERDLKILKSRDIPNRIYAGNGLRAIASRIMRAIQFGSLPSDRSHG